MIRHVNVLAAEICAFCVAINVAILQSIIECVEIQLFSWCFSKVLL